MILACGTFTSLAPVAPQAYSPPYSPVDATMYNICPQEHIQPIPQLPSPVISPISKHQASALVPSLSQFSNGSLDSDCASVFSDSSSASSTSSTSSYEQFSNTMPNKIAAPVAPQHQYVSPAPSGWYAISHLHRVANYFQSFQHVPIPQVVY